MSGCRQ